MKSVPKTLDEQREAQSKLSSAYADSDRLAELLLWLAARQDTLRSSISSPELLELLVPGIRISRPAFFQTSPTSEDE